MKWTNEQYKAITTKNCNLLVSAGAGSGKTAVLVERIVNMVLNDKIDINNILVVTFTNAAANEMKERILNKLYEKLEDMPDDIWLQKQVINMGSANITTIHSFCLSVIKQYYYQIGIEPNLKVANEIDNELMKYEILQEMFDEQYEKEQIDVEFLNLQEMFDENNKSDNLKEIILKIYKFAINQPFPQRIYEQLRDIISTKQFSDFEQTVWGKVYIQYCISIINNIIKQIDLIIDVINDDQKQLDFYELQKHKAKNMLEIQNKTWDEAIKMLMEYTLDKKVQMRGYDEDTKAIVDVHWKSIKNMYNSISCNVLEADINKGNQINQRELLYLIDLVIEFDKRFKNNKSNKKVIDFNDFEHYALQILLSTDENGNILPSEVAKEYRKKFEEILIDEYQDSNYIQDYILNVISRCDEGNPNIFMVGDVKQSIYKFRGAKPEIFLEKYYTYKDEENSKFRKINLYKNFRSRDGILEFINYIFSKIMTKEIGQLEYTKEEFLNYGADYKNIDTNNYNIELDVITLEDENIEDSKQEIEDDEDSIKSENIEYEAQFVANKIKELIKEKYKVLDKKTNQYRDIKYSDIVILLRNTKSTSSIFSQIFKENNIPIYIDNKVGYLDELEVSDVLSFLQIIDNPYQDIPLIATLKSPFGNFDDNQLAKIRQYDINGNFYKAMQKASVTDEKVNEFLKNLNRYITESKYLSVSQLIWNIYEDYQYIAYMKRYRDYESKKANLILLFERARQFEDSSYKGLFNFINFIFKIKDNNQDMGSATIIGENDDVVKLMSIHKSKGLEFPIVFLCNTDKGFNFMDIRSKFLLHQKLFIGNDIIDLEKRISYKSIFKKIMDIRMKQEIIAEEIRMLYVALTRAKEKLIITGVTKSEDDLINKSKTYMLEDIKSYLSFILYAIYTNGYTKNIDINYIPNVTITKQKQEKLDNINLKQLCIENEQKIINNEFDKDKYDNISNQMSSIYKKEYLKCIPHKISVTDIKRIIDGQRRNDNKEYKENIIPKWISHDEEVEENKSFVTATEKGNIYHYIFQNLNFNKIYTYDTLKQEIDNMKKITDREKAVIDINKILNFTKTDLYIKIKDADRIYKEQTFMLELSIEEVKDVFQIEDIDIDMQDTILIQGTIDMFFVKNGEAIIVDYKTDKVYDKIDIKQRYKVQLQYYKKALEKVLGLKVKGCYIYLVNTNKIVEME